MKREREGQVQRVIEFDYYIDNNRAASSFVNDLLVQSRRNVNTRITARKTI